MNIPTKQEIELKYSTRPELQNTLLRQSLSTANQHVLFLTNLIKFKDFQETVKTYDLATFIYGLENLQRNTALLLESVKVMHQEKENDG
jgi:hypothetical protein